MSPHAAPPATIRLVLPLPPGVNNQYVSVGRRRVLSAPAKSFNRDVTKIIASLRASGSLPAAVEDAFAKSLLGVYLIYFFETPHRRDLDGGLKISLDALGRSIGFDDRAIVDLHLSKRIDPLHPRVEVEIETISEWEFDQTYSISASSPPTIAGRWKTPQQDASTSRRFMTALAQTHAASVGAGPGAVTRLRHRRRARFRQPVQPADRAARSRGRRLQHPPAVGYALGGDRAAFARRASSSPVARPVSTTTEPRRCPPGCSSEHPVLGICYGMHLIANALDGVVEAAHRREYGPAA